MTNKMRSLLGYVAGQMHDSVESLSVYNPHDALATIFLSVAMRKIADEIESGVMKKTGGNEIEIARKLPDVH